MRNSPIFEYGDRIQLTDVKGKIYSFTLKVNGQFHTHLGWIEHSNLVGLSEGRIVETTGGLKYLAFKPLYADYVLGMPRGATIVYPKDSAYILGLADIKNGDKVLESGIGSGALSIAILQAIGDSGHLHSVERREEFAITAQKNISEFFGQTPSNFEVTVCDLAEFNSNMKFDRVVLDMLAPWEHVDLAAKVLRPGGVFISYVATTTQLSNIAEALRSQPSFTEPQSLETILRPWHHDGLAVRPEHRMIGHTGFLTISRKMTDGQIPLVKRRRPSKGKYGLPNDENVE